MDGRLTAGFRMRAVRSLLTLSLAGSLLAASCGASIFGKEKLPIPQWGLDAYKILLANSVT